MASYFSHLPKIYVGQEDNNENFSYQLVSNIFRRVILEEKLIRMTDARKKIINKNGLSVKPVFHPAYILRNSKMRDMWILDLKQAFDLSKNS